MRDTIYGYFTATTSDGRKGFVCVAIKRPPMGSGLADYKAAFSFCSPVDQFARAKGRTIATGKLNSTKVDRNITFQFNKAEKSYKELFEAAMDTANDARRQSGLTFTPEWMTDCTVTYGR